jgi:outer membrane protein OmpA-like peptidoglycan-associated protein
LTRKVFVLICLALSLQTLAAAEATKENIVCALDPKCTKPINSRGITSSGGAPGSSLSVNLYVNFPYNSVALLADARITLDRLGYALSDNRLGGFKFMISGHTDARGGVEFNKNLSERRAQAVRQYLIVQFGIEPSRLSAQGYGKAQLLDPTHPEDGVNRRVQVQNLTASRHP